VSFPEWTPDRPRYQRGLGKATNCYPRTSGQDGSISYGPYPAPQIASAALPARCVGAFAARSLAGNVSIFAATRTGIYKLTTAATWTDVSGAAYTTALDGFWEFIQFGEFVICTNFADVPQVYQLDVSATFANLGGSPPRAKHIAVIEPGFVVLGHLNVAGTIYPNGQQWSAYNDHTNWDAGHGGGVRGAADPRCCRSAGGCEGLSGRRRGERRGVLRYGIFRMGTRSRVVFQFIGAVRAPDYGPFSVVAIGVKNSQTVALFFGDDGFHAFDGTSTQPIGMNKVDQYALSLFSRANQARICASLDPTRNLVLWMLPNQGDTSTVLIAFNWDLAAFSELDPPAMVASAAPSPGGVSDAQLRPMEDVLATRLTC
jgi:hypothetical protein